tara:strand:+ start:1113 stop:2087 length:975 start_codon:yes stop_codon:yes gene_type:complete
MNILKNINYFFSPKNLLGIFVSGLCIYWSFRNFDSDIFINQIKSINIYLFVFAALLLILTVFIRSFRWLLFFNSEESKKLKLFDLFKNQMIGYFGNNIFPLRLGDLLRVSKMSRATSMLPSYLLGTIVAERIIDILSLLLLLLLAFPFIWNHELIVDTFSNLQYIDLNNFYFYIFILLFLSLIIYFLFKNNKFIDWNSFILAFANIRGCKKIVKIIILSSLIWIIYLLNIIIISNSMTGISSFTILDSFLLLVFITFSIVVLPSVPGSIGTFQAAVIFIMTSSLFNYDKSTALSFSIVLHSYSYITYSFIGGYFFLRSNVELNK